MEDKKIDPKKSILLSIKKLLNIDSDCTDFDTDIIMHINTVLMQSEQIGLGDKVFQIEDETSVWEDFLSDINNFAAVKTYIYLKVKLLFDPPLNTSIIESIKENIRELEWRLNIQAENKK